jgi:Fur family peroxide stress response transcriptional regulator
MTNLEVAEKLRSFGINPSQPRIAIYSYLDSRRNHPTADMVYAELHQEYPSLSKTTVYNTLKLFHSSGAVQQVIIEDSEMRFDCDISRHAHFKCRECEDVYDLFFDPVKFLPELDQSLMVEEIHVNYRGICRKCSGRK